MHAEILLLRKLSISSAVTLFKSMFLSTKLSMIVELDTAEHFIFAAFYYCVFWFNVWIKLTKYFRIKITSIVFALRELH